MKILKPGKVEQRKFVCSGCGCVFVAGANETTYIQLHDVDYLFCPTCREELDWRDGEPYEKPTQGCINRLTSIIADLGYVNETTAWDIAIQLAEHGVTFREG